MATSFTFRRGDTYEPLILVPFDENNAVVDLSGATSPTIRVGLAATPFTVIVDNETCEILTDQVVDGVSRAFVFRYYFTSDEANSAAGVYGATVTVTIGGKLLTFPTLTNFPVTIIAKIP
jgi:hypothetical protein